jgi:hypothetical protein
MAVFAVAIAWGQGAAPNLADEDFHIYTDAPRLLLNKGRLRLLQRERERKTPRWERFDELVESGAPLPEPGFALALHYRISGDAASGRKAVEWALGAADDLRQLALVFDWCGPAMTEAQAARLGEKIEKALAAPESSPDARRQAARVFAAAAIADRLKDHGESVLRSAALNWWRDRVAPSLESAQPLVPREQLYWILEILHAYQDNLRIDLRESAPAYFKELGLAYIAGYYPAPYPGPDNDFYIPAYARAGEPDLRDAALGRAAGFALVAYDNNSENNQFVQGWLSQDRFMLRGDFGAPYEFLWANPYQPGLSYFHLPLLYHNAVTGELFARTSWDEDATWIGFFNHQMQMFRDGQVQTLRQGAEVNPVRIAAIVLMSAPAGEKLQVQIDSESLFLLGLAPKSVYEVEIDDQEMREVATDSGGTLVLSSAPGLVTAARLRKRP